MSKKQSEETEPRMKRKQYEKKPRNLQTELCRRQDWADAANEVQVST